MGKFNLGALLLLSSGHMVVDTYQGALPAVLPFIKENLGLSYTVTGIIMIVANFASSIVQPLFGLLSDKKEKAFLLPLGAFLAGAGFCFISLTQNYFLILFLVTISGLGVAAYHPEGFKTARFFTGDRTATGMSVFAVGGNTGMALGPILSLSIINYLGFSSLPLMIVPSLLIVATILLRRKSIAIPESSKAKKTGSGVKISKEAYRAIITLICTIIMRTWTHVGIITYIPFYYINHLKGDPVFAGKAVSLFLLGGAIGTLTGAPLADRWGHKQWLRLSLFVSAALFPLIFFTDGYMLLIVMTVLGIILISSFSITVVMGQNILPGNLGIVSGLIVGFAIGAGGIGVTLLGVIADHYGAYFALKSIGILPVIALLFSFALKYPLSPEPLSRQIKPAD